MAFGKIEINKSGTGFVHTKEGYVILIENNLLNGALDGDSVIVTGIVNKRKDYYAGEVFKVVKRGSGIVIFQIIGNGKEASLVPYDTNTHISVGVNPRELDRLLDGDLVKIRVSSDGVDGLYHGSVEKVIGNKNDLDIDIKVIAAKYDIPYEFREEVLNEVKCLPKEVRAEDLVDRVDLRSENIFTIDCDQTKDRDDAVGVKLLDNGNFLLKVNIAHVSYYIKPGMKSFDEALDRCFSHYLLFSVINLFTSVILFSILSKISSLSGKLHLYFKSFSFFDNSSKALSKYKLIFAINSESSINKAFSNIKFLNSSILFIKEFLLRKNSSFSFLYFPS